MTKQLKANRIRIEGRVESELGFLPLLQRFCSLKVSLSPPNSSVLYLPVLLVYYLNFFPGAR